MLGQGSRSVSPQCLFESLLFGAVLRSFHRLLHIAPLNRDKIAKNSYLFLALIEFNHLDDKSYVQQITFDM